MGRAEPWDEYAERHQNGWTRDEYEKEYEAVERAMAGEDPVGAFRGMWFLVRLMLTVGLFVVLCFDVARHFNAGTWEAGFIQVVAWAAFSWLLNTIPKWRDMWVWGATGILFTALVFAVVSP